MEDELAPRRRLLRLIEQAHPDLKICGTFSRASEARVYLSESKVDLVFLDIHLPGESGFDLLDAFPERSFQVIFVTGYDHYAIRAIRCQALDYLLKPVDRNALKAAIGRIKESIVTQKPEIPSKKEASGHPDSLTLYHRDGFDLVRFVDILYLKGEDNYTRFFLEDGTFKLATRTLREFENLLAPVGFIRIHKSHIVNPRWIKSYRFENSGRVEMIDGQWLDVSRRRSEMLFAQLDRFSISTRSRIGFRS